MNNIHNLANKYGTPLQIYDETIIKSRCDNLIKNMSQKLPNYKNYFAVKALPNIHILKLLWDLYPKERYFGFDCSSMVELMMINRLGINGEHIMYTSNYQSKEDMNYAISLGATINIDNEDYVDIIYEICKEQNIPFLNKLFFRINPLIGETNTVSKSNILGGEDSKFGISIDKMITTIKKAISYGVTEVGLHMMTGSGILNIDYFNKLTKEFHNLIDLCEKNGIIVSHLNIGGGLGIPYSPDQKSIDVAQVSQIVSTLGTRVKSVTSEHGRYITGESGMLITKINSIKNRTIPFIGVDACMSNLMRPGMYGSYHHIEVLNNSKEKQEYNVVGGLCENNDWFAKKRILNKASVGDIVVIYCTGAHSHSMGFQYNGKLRAPEVLVNKDSVKLIRRRETFEDYISTII